MKISRGLSVGAVFGLVAILMIAPVSIGTEYTYCGEQVDVQLTVAKNFNGGSVVISNNADMIWVEFSTDSPWKLEETHVHVADCWEDIPQTKSGNAKPGKFDYSEEHNYIDYYLYEIPMDEVIEKDCGDTIYIAAHAVVAKPGTPDATIACPPPVVWETETGWGDDQGFPGKDWSMYIEYELQCCGKMPDFPAQAYAEASYPGTSTYWDLDFSFDTTHNEMSEGVYAAWCAKNGVTMGSNWHGEVNLYATYPVTSNVPAYEWDKINWIVNQLEWGNYDTYTKTQIQNAFWYFTNPPDPDVYPNQLAEDADDMGDGFFPPAGGWMAIYVTSQQPTFIVLDP